MHVYEFRPRKDHRGVDLISDVLPFGRLWYGEHRSRSHDDAVIRVYDESGNVIETRGHKGEILERISKLGISRWHHLAGAPKDQSNRRKYMPGYAVWEIHSVMAITVQ